MGRINKKCGSATLKNAFFLNFVIVFFSSQICFSGLPVVDFQGIIRLAINGLAILKMSGFKQNWRISD
jgi:hypothetical protein